MAKTKSEIIKKIKGFIKRNGGSYSSWYVGITEEPKKRLLGGHGAKGTWIYTKAKNSTEAREIEEYFIEKLGTDGGGGGGDKDAKYVYAYKKKPHTEP